MQAKTLFSQHYLIHRLPQHPEWAEDPRPVLEAIRSLWARARQHGDTWNEAQTEEEFIKPVLRILGWSYIVQIKTGRGGRVSRPDYALFADDRSRDEAYRYQDQDDPFYSRARAVAEAKYWGRPLSQKDTTGRDTRKSDSNPSFQMVSYLVGTRVPWGILTNGILWRLYSREVSSTASEFYEVDLRVILDFLPPDCEPSPEQLDQFRRWWLFFRRDAFLPDAQGKSFVQRVHEGSTLYARQISDKLKELVFEEVMPQIAGGFVAYRYHRMGVQEETPETLRQIYQASLSLLYKLLFLLYAEARGLLPINNEGYREQSLTALAQWAAERLDKGLPISDALHATTRYDALLNLFRRVDQGDPSLGIPRYNGGLFSPASPENQFLESHRLSDRVVARAVDLLARDARKPVDYAYISVRNLGAIYEGLLEYKLRVVDAAAGKVELVTDRGERKATGSYYTPDYIVNYIIQNTLGPVLDERAHVFRDAMDRCADLRWKLARTSDPSTVRLLREQLEQAEREAREAFLSIKVCDPAMGSGHFLVNAVDFLTDGIIRQMQAYHDERPNVPWEWNPIQRLVGQVRGEILEEMRCQGVEVDRARLDDTAILTRLVMKRCIYGVDLNRMAVELAKLSLWLHSFTVGAPLSFLDHHLRWGNSLIGADVRTVERALKATQGGQLSLFAGPFAGLLDLTGLMVEVAEQADATLADVQRSAEIFEHFQEQLTPYKQVLDLWVSQHFGNPLAYEFLTLYGGDVLPALKGDKAVPEEYREAVDRARALWEEKRFFHWDLEFPEVFIDLRRRDWAENPGFDAVIGNPPYLNVKRGSLVEDRAYLTSRFHLAKGQWDAFELFYEQAHSVLKAGGTWSFIIPKPALSNENYELLRTCWLKNAELFLVADAGMPFQEVGVEAIIAAIRKGVRHDRVAVYNLDDAGPALVNSIASELCASLPFKIIPLRLAEPEVPIILKIRDVSAPFSSLADLTRGIEAGKDAPFVYDDPGAGRVPLGFGEDLHRYDYQANYWVQRDESDSNKFKPARLYSQTPKLLLRRVGIDLIAAVDTTQSNVLNTIYVAEVKPDVNLDLYYLCALINSPALAFWFKKVFVFEERLFPYVRISQVSWLPIRRISFTPPADERERLAAEGRALAADAIHSTEHASYSAFLSSPLGLWLHARLSADPEQSDVVHDLLAHLAGEMVRINREKQEEVRGFLTWLEREVGAPLKALTGHTRLRAYLGDYRKEEPHLTLEELLEILRRNRRRLKVDPSARAFQARLEKEYGDSLERLLPLKRLLAATDRLIDLTVCRLYGLTEEEVRVVEEALKQGV